MGFLAWLDALNLLRVFNYYLILGFIVSTGVNCRTYWAMIRLMCGFPNRWPKLLELVKKHRTIFLGWPTLLAIGLALMLMLGNSLAIHLVWVQAKVTVDELWGRWLPLAAVLISAGLMFLLDCKAIFSVSRFDRAALEETLDQAESWMKSWMAPALRMVTLGFIHPRKIVSAEVQGALASANWIMIGGMWRLSLRTGMQVAVGLSLWLTWAFALRAAA